MPPRQSQSLRTTRYAAAAEFEKRHFGWRFLIEPLDNGDREEIDFDNQIVRVTPGFYAEGPQWCIEHEAAHIDLHADPAPECFTDEHCAIANTLAEIRLYP